MKKKGLPYPEARNQTSQYMTGRRTMPEELRPSQDYKNSATASIRARLQAAQNPVKGDIDSYFAVKEAGELKESLAYDEATRIRNLQKKLDGPDIPLHKKGKINVADRMIQELGFEKIPHISGKPGKTASSGFSYLQKSSKKVIPGLAAIAALSAPDMAQAAVDMVVPGGVEPLGVSEEQKRLDEEYTRRVYQDRVRARQEVLNNGLKP